jgi:hypothetical protein
MAAIRGPILLITLGVLVAIDYFGPWSFSRTWPVLLIAYGILKLLEKAFEKTDRRPDVSHPGGSVI